MNTYTWKIFLFRSISFFRTHAFGLLLAGAVTLAVSLPPVIWHFSTDFRGVEMLKTNTEAHYVAQVQEVYDGHPRLGNTFFQGLKNSDYLFPPLSPNLVALFGKLIGVGAVGAVIVGRFLFVFLLALAIYGFAYRLFGSTRWAAVAAPFIILGYALFDPHTLLRLFSFGQGAGEATFIDYGRPINPQISSLFFFGYLYFFWQFLIVPSRRTLLGVVSAVLLGASFYVYLFTWTYLFTLNGFLFLLFLLRKDFESVKRVVAVTIAAAVLGIPYAFNLLAASQNTWYAETAVRFGFVASHAPNISRLVLGLIVVYLFAKSLLTTKQRVFFGSFFVTALVVANEQIITGKYIFNHHYHWYYTTPLVALGVLAFFAQWFKAHPDKKRVEVLAVALLVALFFVQGIKVQVLSYQASKESMVDEQRYAPVIDWFNHESPLDSVIFAPAPLLRLLPAVTHNNVYYYGTGIYTLVSNERLMDTYLAQIYLQRVPQVDIRLYLDEHQAEIAGWVFGYTFSFQPGVCSTCVPEDFLDKAAERYRQLTDANFASFLLKYPLDYIVTDEKTDPGWRVDRFGFVPVAKFGTLTIHSAAALLAGP